MGRWRRRNVHLWCDIRMAPKRKQHYANRRLMKENERILFSYVSHFLLFCALTLNVPVTYKYGTHQCVEPRFHALEPHFPRASQSRPTHSSRGSGTSTQLAFPRKTRFRAFPRICGPKFRAFPCNWKPQFRAFPRKYSSFGEFWWLNKPRIPAQW